MRTEGIFLLVVAMVMMAGCSSVDRGSFGPFMRSLNTTSHGYSVVPDPTGSAPTKTVERFEVRRGDCSGNQGWSDCENDRERSELSEKTKATRAGDEWWYGWSIYVPADYVNVYPTKVAMGQFHQDKSHPVWMFQNAAGGYHLDDQVSGSTRHIYEILSDQEMRGRWNRIEVQVRWSRSDDGFFRVWANGVQKVDYAGATMSADKVYFKYGLYRSFLSRYKASKNVAEVPAQTVYYSDVRRSSDRAGLHSSGS